jgi:hypothetical protein
MITGASFFGEAPSPAEQQASFRLFLWSLACGLVVPFAGLVLQRRGQEPARSTAAAATAAQAAEAYPASGPSR